MAMIWRGPFLQQHLFICDHLTQKKTCWHTEFILAGWSFLPLVYAYRLTNQSPEHKLLLQLLGEAPKSKPLLLLQASFIIPLALPDRNQNKAARLGGEREAWGQVEI